VHGLLLHRSHTYWLQYIVADALCMEATQGVGVLTPVVQWLPYTGLVQQSQLHGNIGVALGWPSQLLRISSLEAAV
jgi:hypothetical protein